MRINAVEAVMIAKSFGSTETSETLLARCSSTESFLLDRTSWRNKSIARTVLRDDLTGSIGLSAGVTGLLCLLEIDPSAVSVLRSSVFRWMSRTWS